MRTCGSAAWRIGSAGCGPIRDQAAVAARRSNRLSQTTCHALCGMSAGVYDRQQPVVGRFDRNDYSVPVRWAHQSVWSKAIGRKSCSIPRAGSGPARRIWEDEQVCFEPLHYLALLEKSRRVGSCPPWLVGFCRIALGVATAFGKRAHGRRHREYIKVLRLLEKHPLPKLRGGGTGAGCGAITRDAIAQFLFPREDWRFTAFSLEDIHTCVRSAWPLPRLRNTATAGRCAMSKDPSVLLLEHHLKR